MSKKPTKNKYKKPTVKSQSLSNPGACAEVLINLTTGLSVMGKSVGDKNADPMYQISVG